MTVKNCLNIITAEYIGDINYAFWIEDLFWEIMKHVPNAQFCENHGIYFCIDCGKSTASKFHYSKR